MSEFPVIIAACNEEAYIGRTLTSLTSAPVTPIVVVNGSTDGTAHIAEGYGATVIHREEPGKLPALQAGLKSLGRRALDSVLLLDADSYPVYPKGWALTMAAHLQANKPTSVSGLIHLVDGNPIDDAVRGLRHFQLALRHRQKGVGGSVFGSNMGLRIHDTDVFEKILALPSIWPGEDSALADVVAGQIDGYEQLVHPATRVATSARYHMPLSRRIRYGAEAARRERSQDYASRVPEGTQLRYGRGRFTPYNSAAGGKFTLAEYLAGTRNNKLSERVVAKTP